MKKLSKILSLALAVIMAMSLLVACNDKNENDGSNTNNDLTVRVAGMTGPTGIGLVSLMDKNEKSQTAQKYKFDLYASAQEIVPLLAKGELDIAAIPANLAAVQFTKNNGFIKVIAINNLGVLSILEKGTAINSVADLNGKVI